MTAAVTFKCFTLDGDPVPTVGGSGSITLPYYLDWMSIKVKELYLRRIGGFPPETHYMLITSQGETKLLKGLQGSNTPQDYKQRKDKEHGIQEWLEAECRRLGINFARKPRGQ